jgi:hypothetical protein
MMISGAARRVQQFVCGLHGHDMVRHFDKGRMSLQCVSCGHESPGWELPALAVRRIHGPNVASRSGPPRQERHA